MSNAITTKPSRNRKRQDATAAKNQRALQSLLATRDARQIREWPGYMACSSGEIISKQRGITLCPANVGGYLYVTLCDQNGKSRHAVHRLVAAAFHGDPPLVDSQVNHINGAKTDNRSQNLEWVSRAENQRHAADIGLKPTGEKSHLAKLTEGQVREIRSLAGIKSQKEIGDQFGVSQTCINKIITGKKWKQLS
jgi:hypothetical protein